MGSFFALSLGVLGLLFCCRWCVIVVCYSEVLCAVFCDVFGVCIGCSVVFVFGELWCYSVLLQKWCSGFIGFCCFWSLALLV